MSRAIPVNPKLPARFDDTPNDARPRSHQRWWFRPFIVTEEYSEPPTQAELPPTVTAVSDAEREKFRADWLKWWPSGIRYDVRCLDGGAWDRSTWWGSFATLEEAERCARDRDPRKFEKLGLL